MDLGLRWNSDDLVTRRHELYSRAAAVFRGHGYRGSTLKALAEACGLSMAGLYRYFPSKRAFALFPLMAMYPELHGPPPDVSGGDPVVHLSAWVEGATREMPNYILAMRMALEIGLSADERAKIDADLAAHASVVGSLVLRAQPRLNRRVATEIAGTMMSIAVGPALTGLDPAPESMGRDLRALLHTYGIRTLSRPAPGL